MRLQGGQVQVAVDAAELLGGLDHSGRAPAQRHLPVAPALTLRERSRLIEIIDSMAFVLRRHGVRRIAVAHPQVFPLVASRPTAAPWLRPPLRSLPWVESLDTLVTQGFSDDGAMAAYRGFSSYLLGHLLLEVSALGADVGPVDWPAAQTDSTAQHAETTTLARFPQLQRLEPQLSENHSSAEFEESLEGLMDRLQLLRPLARR